MEIRADILKKALADRAKSRGNIFFTEVYTNDGRYPMQRFDGVEFHGVHNTHICGYEVKVQRSDFLQDNKWTGYLNFCNEFYFACPEGLVKEKELPLEVGLVYYKPNGRVRTKRRAVPREIKPPFKMLSGLLFNRIDEERHPFFSEQREKIKAYLDDKETRRELAIHFKSKLVHERDAAIKENIKLKSEIDDCKEYAEAWGKTRQILIDAGIWQYPTERALASLKEAIMYGNPHLIETVQKVVNLLNPVLKNYKV